MTPSPETSVPPFVTAFSPPFRFAVPKKMYNFAEETSISLHN